MPQRLAASVLMRLTGLAERYGAEYGSVTTTTCAVVCDNMPAIHASLLVLMACLHARTVHAGKPPETRDHQ